MLKIILVIIGVIAAILGIMWLYETFGTKGRAKRELKRKQAKNFEDFLSGKISGAEQSARDIAAYNAYLAEIDPNPVMMNDEQQFW